MALDNFRKINITLNKANQHVLEPQITKVGDVNGRELVVQLIDGGVIKDQTGVLLKLNWQHANGNQGSETFSPLDAKQGVFSVYYPQNMLFRGTVTANISINENGKITNSLNFQIAVKGDVFDGSAVEVDGILFTLKDLKDQLDERDGNLVDLENRQTSVESQFNSLQQEMTDKDVISAPEIIAARNGEANLKARLDQTDKRIPNIANATSTLKILNPYGNFQNIHPKVLYFKDGWNGYKWWMAYTPYPNSNTRQENPCIAVSNNGLDWTVPEGFENEALDEWNGILGAWNADTHLVYREDINTLEVWWKYINTNTDSRISEIKRRTTIDGVNWTETEVMITGTVDTDDNMSPAIVFENGKYRMLSINALGGRKAYYRESLDSSGKTWTSRTDLNIDLSDGLTLWHVDFIKTEKGYETVFQAYETGKDTNWASLYYTVSPDLVNFEKPVKILSPTNLPTGFDNQGIYRSSLVKIDETYYLFYSSVSSNKERAMALSYGDNIYALKGFSTDIENLEQLRLTKNNKRVILEPDENINNKLDIIQATDTSKFGHLKIGHLFFDDGIRSSSVPDNSTIRYNTVTDAHETYNGTKWVGLNTKVFARLSQEIQLTSETFVDIPFNNVDFTDGKYSDGIYTPTTTDNFKVTIGLNIRGVNDGDSFEIQIKNTNDADIFLVWRGNLTPDSSSIQHISAVVPFITDQAWKVSVKYTGSSSTARTTNYQHQNRMLIEGF